MTTRSLTLCATIALSAFMATGASADVHYALEATAPPAEQRVPSHWTVSYWIKGGRERVESAFAPGVLKRVNITQADANREFEVDPAEKIYTVRHIATAGMEYFVTPSPIMPPLPAPVSAETPSTGTSVIDFTVDEKGRETVNDVDARHCIVTLREKTTGCAQSDYETVKLELWVANAKTGRLDCPQRYAGQPATAGQSSSTPTKPDADCVPAQTLTGDTAALRDIFSHLIVKEIITVNGKQVMSLRLKEYSTVPLTAALFTVPPSFKMLSKRDYAQRERSQLEARLLETTPDGGPKPASVADDTNRNGGADYTPSAPAMNGPVQPEPAAAPGNGDDGDDMPNLPNPGAGVKDKVRPWLRL